MDVADAFGQETVRQVLGGRARFIVLKSAEAAVSAPWEAADVDHIEGTDGRSIDELVEAVRSWIEHTPAGT